MAQYTGTYSTYDGKGLREDLSNYIYDISPEDVPFTSMLPKVKAKATKHEWQLDALATATTDNAYIQGDEFTYTDSTATERVGNFTQIMRKSLIVTKTMDAVDKAGRKSETAYQVAKRGKELKRDIEMIYLNNQASLAGDNTTAPLLGGFPAWLTTNVERGTGGADGGYQSTTGVVDAATDATSGDQRAFTETLLKAALLSQYNEGGKANILMMSAFQKQKFSAFSGISDLRTNYAGSNKSQATILAGADFYISDFGTLTCVVNRFQRSRDVFVIDSSMVKMAILRPMNTVDPAVTGDATKKVLICEKTLVVNNEAAHAQIADCTTS